MNLPLWTENPVLIYGPHKSGSTLMQRLLDGHSSAWCYPNELKLKFLIKQPPATRRESLETNKHFCLLQSFEHPRWDHQKFKEMVSKMDNFCVGIEDYIRGLSHISWQCVQGSPESPHLWITKEVGGAANQVMAAWKHMYYNGRIIFILRHPLHVVRSIVLLRLRMGKTMSLHRTYRAMNDTLKVTWNCVRHADKKWAFPVLYESLTSDDTELLLRRLCTFLDLEFEHILLKPTIFGEPTIVATSSKQTTEVFTQEKRWTTGLGKVHIGAMWVMYVALNNLYAFKAKMWKYRSYSKISSKISKLVAAPPPA
ncbi:MAG: sulfotransferase [Prosthecobacter sp.]